MVGLRRMAGSDTAMEFVKQKIFRQRKIDKYSGYYMTLSVIH